MTPCSSPEDISRLSEAIGEFLHREEGRGQQCTVEHVRRTDGTDYFLAYPDDFSDTILVHDEEGNLMPRSLRPTFEIVFAYSQADGTLELNAKIPSRLKPELEDIFCQIILGQPAKDCGAETVYDLNVLKDGPQRLETDPEDRVTPVVRRLRLAIPESRATITLEADRAGGPESIYRMLAEYLNRERLPLSDLNVASATIGLVLHPTNCRKAGRLTFDVSRPDTCTLRNHRPDQVALRRSISSDGGLPLLDTLHAILKRTEREPAIFHADQIAVWPRGQLDRWVASGVLQPISPAGSLPTLCCGGEQVGEVVFLTDADTSRARAYLCCPHCGPSPVSTESLRRWRVDVERLVEVLFAEVDVARHLTCLEAGRLWRVGKASKEAGRFTVFFGRQLHYKDANKILKRAASRLGPSCFPHGTSRQTWRRTTDR